MGLHSPLGARFALLGPPLFCLVVVVSARRAPPERLTACVVLRGAGEQASICREGCAMSCVAMALVQGGFGEAALLGHGEALDPGSLNKWLQARPSPRPSPSQPSRLLLLLQLTTRRPFRPPSPLSPIRAAGPGWQANDGYHCDKGDCNNLVLTAPSNLTGGRVRLVGEWAAAAVSAASLTANLRSGDMACVASLPFPPSPPWLWPR